ncbi:MAG TPA: glucoamylase family protein [Blastocatellia bacterium]|nr:glucoamylase family protein [Blastocatellia bacterium]
MKSIRIRSNHLFSASAQWNDEEPIREELFSVERLEQYAATLATEHQVQDGSHRGRQLLPQFEENGRQLTAAYRKLTDAVMAGQAISPAAEWLIDNFHIVEEQLRQIREDLPKSYYYQLPKLRMGEMQGFPRIYAIAYRFIAHTDSRFDGDSLRRYIRAYQEAAPLTIGELWAIAITLRLALLENLKRLTARVVIASNEREEADALADKLLAANDQGQRAAVAELIQKLEARKQIGRAFVVQLTQRLRDQDPDVAPLIEWIEQGVQSQGLSIEQVVQLEHHRQAASQVTVGNIITSMKSLSTFDWPNFVESVSLTEPMLGADPTDTYAHMDFATRDRYRHEIERIARRTRTSEMDVTHQVVTLAQQSHERNPQDLAQAHVGYYLIDEGRAALEQKVRYRPSLLERAQRWALHHPTLFYFGLFALLIGLLLTPLLFLADRAGATPIGLLVIAVLALIPATDLALSILNWDITHTFKPRILPKMEKDAETPMEARTMIVVPTMLTSEKVAAELIEKLEVHYLANQDPQFYFALLTDFADAPTEEMPNDEALLTLALDGIERLNARYADSENQARFFLFHRRRQWNESEGKWIAWERKRGKLEEFNRLLRGAHDTSFVVVSPAADAALLSSIRYVITLDSDTQLPRDAARKLVATIRHPLNQAQLDPDTRRVVRGYGILQPRVSVTLESSARSRFARIFSGNTGVDPYSTAASDVYQDLFGEGSFIGKGLYDVDAFQAALDARVPDNALLSHDLFEGLYARAALVSDIELLDDYPAHYDTYAKRQHRWTRGDWQIARWLLPRVPNNEGKMVSNRLPLISRWKIFDNLRRSLVAPALLLWLIAAWTFLPGSPLWWTLFALLTVSFPVYAHVTTSLLSHPRGVPWTSYFWHVWSDFGTNTKQVALTLLFLPHQAWVMLDAIARVAYRKLISGKHLLEWVTAAQTESSSKHDREAFWELMYPVTIFAVLLSLLVVVLRPQALWLALPFLLVWAASPMLAYFVSSTGRTFKEASRELSQEDRQTLRLIARRTWRFFETFVGDTDHWLPPDNFQEDPRPVIAHRTSPTNMGLLLLSTCAARDFGYVGLLETVERLELSFVSLRKLEKFHGHFFNWYDTTTLAPLHPQYISTVDSGNLAGHLIAVKQAVLDLSEQKLFDARWLQGLADTLTLLREEAKRIGTVKERTQVVTVKQLNREIEACVALVTAMQDAPEELSRWATFFDELTHRAGEVEDISHALEQEQGADTTESFAEFHFWIAALLTQTRAARRDFDTLISWNAAQVGHLTPLIEHAAPHLAARWQQLAESFSRVPTVSEMTDRCVQALSEINQLLAELAAVTTEERSALLSGLSSLTSSIEKTALAAANFLHRTGTLVKTCDELVEAMDFQFLFDQERKLFTIGYNISEGRRDNSFYDLLASESRLASLVAIAKGDAPQEHWFRLGRQLTQIDGAGRALVSWTATMFEYLMPLLVTRDYAETLLDQTYKAIVARQIAYGREHSVPWGVSESAYNARDLHFNFQYGPFGVPGLGLKRGLSEDLVITPYATVLAALVAPQAALQNMQRLAQTGALARYGFYEAIDYTPERLPKNQTQVIIRSFMAHHQGMSLVALDNVLHHDVMQQRFHANPLIQATELLLQERIPQGVPLARVRTEEMMGRIVNTLTAPIAVSFDSPNQPTPRTQLISNGEYSVMVTSAGAGSSMCTSQSSTRWAVTRWREDSTRDNWGSFCYVRDVRSGAVWSTGYQPTNRTPQSYEVTFTEERAVFKRLDAGIHTQTDIIVSPEDNAEVRRVTLINRSPRVREIELTSYAEIVLAPPAADNAHPAFSNLFVETEFIREDNSLIARRRPRSPHDPTVYAVHTIATEGDVIGAVQYETSRARFLGRGHDTRTPISVMEDRPLSNTVGTVLDPVFSLRQRVRLHPNETARITFSTAVAHSREHILMLADKYHDIHIFERVERLAWTSAQIQLRHLNIEAREAHLFQRLGGRVLYADNSLRPRPDVLRLNQETQSELWKYGISGDLPIVLVRINTVADLEMVRQVLRAHEYLRLKGLPIDLVILNDHPPSYLQELQDELQMLLRSTGLQTLQGKAGGVYVLRTDVMTDEDKILLHTVARVVFVTERGTLEEQLARRPVDESKVPLPFAPRFPARTYPEEPAISVSGLQFFNGLGGFAREGREYVTVLNEGQWTPAPWTNVIANEHDFGFQVTESGAGYTWSVNSRENRLTPWSNDAVSDPPGEIIYLRDEETGTIWTPTPLPVRETEPYVIRHGQGYTIFEHTSHGLAQELTLFVPIDATVKISVLRLRNTTERRRRISVTAYHELVLGITHAQSAPFIVTEQDKDSGAMFARNHYNNEFAGRVAFAAMNPAATSMSCDRKAFIGRNGNTAQPAALKQAKLDDRYGAGLDPCAALQSFVELAPGETRDVIVLFGESASAEDARKIIARYLEPAAHSTALEHVVSHWDATLSSVQVRTPDAAMNLMLNRWLLYQTLSCRLWARSAFYQSGGAYGFRDQLQDVMALVYTKPELTRAQILRAAAHQFKEGDVQHWWHPPTGRGVRTHISDDLLWLPYVTSFYLRVTGDRSILDEVVAFLEAPLLAEGEDDLYLQPQVSAEQATIYEHCLRAIERSLVTGEHGLPLMGAGDWNDGMNRVGNGGKGESVWLGWFLYATLENFALVCEQREEQARAARYREHMTKLKTALEGAWDGDWYTRAYFDDGTPLGSARNDECRIDSIAQSWGVISGAASKQRATHAMAAVEQHLIRRGDGIVMLFTPPFDQGAREPGYIKGYVPGVRENGGQYTHAALWTLIAYAMLGDGDMAGELFALLNPINHSATRAGLHKYRVEPYVAAADIYAVPPHTGRGGWTWYTGSASWMYRAGLESMLGFQLNGNRLRINPCIPRSWRKFEIIFQHHDTRYVIKVENPHGICRGVSTLEVDGELQPAFEIVLVSDGKEHQVQVVLGEQ